MGGTAPRSLCLGGELPIPLRGAAIRSPTVDQKPTRRETHSISTHPWTETRSLGWLLPHLPPPTTDGPAYTAPPQWTTLIPPLTLAEAPKVMNTTENPATNERDDPNRPARGCCPCRNCSIPIPDSMET